jgi:hypothetical protein
MPRKHNAGPDKRGNERHGGLWTKKVRHLLATREVGYSEAMIRMTVSDQHSGRLLGGDDGTCIAGNGYFGDDKTLKGREVKGEGGWEGGRGCFFFLTSTFSSFFCFMFLTCRISGSRPSPQCQSMT